jgi:HEAT repeat protein
MGGYRGTEMGSPETLADRTVPSPELTPDELEAIKERKRLRIKGYLTLLKDPNLNYRWRAAEALGNEEDVRAVEPLLEALKDPFVDVQ